MPRLVALDLGTANVKATVWNVSGRKATFVERLLEPVLHHDPEPAPLGARLPSSPKPSPSKATAKTAGVANGKPASTMVAATWAW